MAIIFNVTYCSNTTKRNLTPNGTCITLNKTEAHTYSQICSKWSVLMLLAPTMSFFYKHPPCGTSLPPLRVSRSFRKVPECKVLPHSKKEPLSAFTMSSALWGVKSTRWWKRPVMILAFPGPQKNCWLFVVFNIYKEEHARPKRLAACCCCLASLIKLPSASPVEHLLAFEMFC